MKQLIIVLTAFLLCSVAAFSQVNDYYFENRDAFQTFPQLIPANGQMAEKSMPWFDVDSLLEEDRELEALGGYPFRFGHAFDVNYTLEDGAWTADGARNVWSLRVRSKGAYSLNFGFSELALAPEAELYVFSSDGSMVYGPVTAVQNTTDGWLYTIPVRGEDVVVQLIEPDAAKELSRLTVSQVIHGYKNVVPSPQDPPTLLSCHNDVCNYSGWTDYSDAVCRILVSGTHLCTGALLNNTSQNYTPYVLTANHCLEGTGNPGPTGWTFQFRYKSCTTAVSFNYADTRATWNRANGTDFLLVQLRSALGDQNLTFLGWDNRAGTNTSNGTGIHHPGGAQMKISFASSALSDSTYYWYVDYNNGTTEGGSSGSPLFNADNRVIGQLWGGFSVCPNPTVREQYGRLNQSWTGNGSMATRLHDWLAPSSSGTQTLNLIPLFSVSGPDLVPCSGTVSYTIPQTRAAGITSITWSTGSSGIQIVSGQGTKTITVQAVSNSSASGNITASLTYGGVTKTISKSVDIGVPHITSISGPTSVGVGSTATFFAEPNFPSSQGDYQWIVSPSTATIINYRYMCDVTFNATGSYTVGVRSTSSCISPGTYTTMSVSVGSYYIVSTGQNNQVTVTLGNGTGTAATVRTIAYSLYNQATGAALAQGQIPASGGTLDFSHLPGGVYVLSLDSGTGAPDSHKIMLK